MKPFFSIITVCLNSEKTIRRTIESVLSQSCRDYEYLIMDGVSSDSTLDIVQEYIKKFHSMGINYQCISKKDDGIYDAMNQGIKSAKGQIIGIINSDDYYEGNTLASVHSAYKKNPGGDIFYGYLRIVNNNKEVVVYRYNFEYFLSRLETGIYSSVQHPACFVKKQVYDEIGLFDIKFKIAADYDFLIRADQREKQFVALEQILANFSKGGASDRMRDLQRFSERYGIWYKNNLISEKEYKKRIKQTHYTRTKQLKEKIIRKIFSFS